MARSKSVTVALDRLWSEVSEEENDILFKCMSKAMRMAKKDVVNLSPGGGEYKRGWVIRTKRYKYGCQGIIYNKDKPGLTHLLENSHVIRNQYGEYGRTSKGHGQVEHIGIARDAAEDYLLQLLTEAHL